MNEKAVLRCPLKRVRFQCNAIQWTKKKNPWIHLVHNCVQIYKYSDIIQIHRSKHCVCVCVLPVIRPHDDWLSVFILLNLMTVLAKCRKHYADVSDFAGLNRMACTDNTCPLQQFWERWRVYSQTPNLLLYKTHKTDSTNFMEASIQVLISLSLPPGSAGWDLSDGNRNEKHSHTHLD